MEAPSPAARCRVLPQDEAVQFVTDHLRGLPAATNRLSRSRSARRPKAAHRLQRPRRARDDDILGNEDGVAEMHPETVELMSLFGAIKPRVKGVSVRDMDDAIRRSASRK
jgi:hypothetical protein